MMYKVLMASLFLSAFLSATASPLPYDDSLDAGDSWDSDASARLVRRAPPASLGLGDTDFDIPSGGGSTTTKPIVSGTTPGTGFGGTSGTGGSFGEEPYLSDRPGPLRSSAAGVGSSTSATRPGIGRPSTFDSSISDGYGSPTGPAKGPVPAPVGTGLGARGPGTGSLAGPKLTPSTGKTPPPLQATGGY